MEKPYLKKLNKMADFDVWTVDGKYIRGAIDEEFTNFGQHYRFNYIPKQEFWIDKEYSPGEEKYFVDNLLIQYKLMGDGVEYVKAFEKACLVEKRERAKSAAIKVLKKLTDKNLIKKVHLNLLKSYSGKNLQIWIVNGELVRGIFEISFTEGGHDQVYNFIPKNEVWLDNDLSHRENKFVLFHELYERFLMAQGWEYEKAHCAASDLEWNYRRHQDQLDEKLKEEIRKNDV